MHHNENNLNDRKLPIFFPVKSGWIWKFLGFPFFTRNAWNPGWIGAVNSNPAVRASGVITPVSQPSTKPLTMSESTNIACSVINWNVHYHFAISVCRSLHYILTSKLDRDADGEVRFEEHILGLANHSWSDRRWSFIIGQPMYHLLSKMFQQQINSATRINSHSNDITMLM